MKKLWNKPRILSGITKEEMFNGGVLDGICSTDIVNPGKYRFNDNVNNLFLEVKDGLTVLITVK